MIWLNPKRMAKSRALLLRMASCPRGPSSRGRVEAGLALLVGSCCGVLPPARPPPAVAEAKCLSRARLTGSCRLGTTTSTCLSFRIPPESSSGPERKGLCPDRDFKVELGGFSHRPVYALKHVPQTSLLVTSGPPDSTLQVWRMEPEETGVIKALGTIPAVPGEEEGTSWVKMATISSQAGCVLHGLKTNGIRMTEVESGKTVFVAASRCAEELSSLHFLEEATLLACSARGQLFLADTRQPQQELGEVRGASLPSTLGGHSWTAGVQSSSPEPAGGKLLVARLSTGGHTVLTDLRNTSSPLKVARCSVPAAPGFRGVECLSVSFAPRLEGHVAVSGFDGTVRIYDTRQWDSSTQEATPVFLHKGHVFGGAGGGSSGDPPLVTTHTWHPSKPRTLLSAASDGSLHVWDWADLQGTATQSVGDAP